MQDFAQALWTPSAEFAASSNMRHYRNWLAETKKLDFQDYNALWKWSVDEVGAFWHSIWEYYEVIGHSDWQTPLQWQPGQHLMEARWFGGARLNYAEHIFRQRSDTRPALLFQSEREALREISWAELYQQTAALTAFLRSRGLKAGDRVAAYLPNTPAAIVGFLAAASIGAVWSACSPDFGVSSVADRFQQIEPCVLIAADGYSYNGKDFDRMEEVRALCKALPDIHTTLLLSNLNPDASPEDLPGGVAWAEALKAPAEGLHFEALPFDHPLWVLYSSGTTGKPKAITHSVGGCLLEHLKALGLHQNCRPGDRFFWLSTTGWMMWNYANAALLHGCTVVVYDGSPAWPDINVLWDIARHAEITHFGAGAAYYISCMKRGLDFRLEKPLPMQSIGSTGSPLPPEGFEWLQHNVKPEAWLISLSGGTDVCSGFVGGCPEWPVYAGEIQCRMLGCHLEAWNDAAEPVTDEVGEMVICKPMPSMPVYFWNDPGGERYRQSYFEHFPGVWRHGDWVKITPRGGVIIYGRSDATLNRDGVRIGTSEVYSAAESVPEVADSLVVCIEQSGGRYHMPLFVVLQDGAQLDVALKKRIAHALRSQYSPRHVPDEIVAVPGIPYTISGKKMETAVKKLLMGATAAQAATAGAMRNPEVLEWFLAFAAARSADNT